MSIHIDLVKVGETVEYKDSQYFVTNKESTSFWNDKANEVLYKGTVVGFTLEGESKSKKYNTFYCLPDGTVTAISYPS